MVSHREDRNTRWQMSLIPFGGYLRLMPEENLFGSRRCARRRRWIRLTLMVAGPATNVLFSLLLLTVLAMTLGEPAGHRLVTSMEASGLAQKAGLLTGDKLLSATRHWESAEGSAESFVRFSVRRKTKYLDLDIPAPSPEVV